VAGDTTHRCGGGGGVSGVAGSGGKAHQISGLWIRSHSTKGLDPKSMEACIKICYKVSEGMVPVNVYVWPCK
jgi:hypothetical protein